MTTIKLVFKSTEHYHKEVLTVDKIYDAQYDETEVIYSSTGLYYTIKDDTGKKREIHESHFITLVYLPMPPQTPAIILSDLDRFICYV